jgi:hypothetical protein
MKFSLPDKAFSIMLPGIPKKNDALNRQDSTASWKFTSYDYMDNTKGLYYLVQVRDLKEGLYLSSDTSYFNSYINDTRPKMEAVSRESVGLYKNFPSLHFDGKFGANVFYKTFHVLRGNRVYLLAVGGPQENFDIEATNLFNSLELEEYKKGEWSIQAGQGFSTFAPFVFSKSNPLKDEGTGTEREHFLCYDDNESLTYNVFKEKLGEYYWVKNDSVFFADRLASYKGDEDSIIRREFSYTGKLKTLDVIIQKGDNHNLEHIKLFVNGDTLYSIISFVPRLYINRDNHQNFFKKFTIGKEVMPTIYTNKASKLFQALQSKDSIVYEKALEALNNTNFGLEDLPLLQNALMQQYRDSAASYNARESLVTLLIKFEDAGTPEFIAGNYSKVTDESLKLSLLQVLAGIQNKASYGILKDLLLHHSPKGLEAGSLKYYLMDSLQLSATLYPEILRLSKDVNFANLLVGLNSALLDSSLLDIKEVKVYQEKYLAFAKTHLTTLKANPEEWWQYKDWIPFMGKFNDKESNALLQSYLAVPSGNFKMHTTLALIKNGQPVSASEVQSIASDKSIRSYFYYELTKIKSENIFPAAYASQQSLAESDIHSYASEEDYEIAAQSFLGEKIINYKGSPQKFYLFKITYNIEEGKKESYLGVTGPYELKSKLKVPFAVNSGLYWDEEFSKPALDKQFKAYILQLTDEE